MFTRASTDSDLELNRQVNHEKPNDDVDGVSSKRRNAPGVMGSSEKNSYKEMTMAGIIMGKEDYFPGLIPLMLAYLDSIQCDSFTMARVTQYLDFIQKGRLEN